MPRNAMSLPIDVSTYLEAQDRKSLLKFITCGHVDDGKSTLIGRLLYDQGLIPRDQLPNLDPENLSKNGSGLASLVDGLAAEREQGITIDVAYRYFSTKNRKFIIADTPGHEQYTRNMATGASSADLAVLLIDARRGVSQQTKRHAHIVSLFGIRHIVIAINKMDLAGYSQARYNGIEEEFRSFAQALAFDSIRCIPTCALRGDNIVVKSAHMPWYHGPSLMEYLDYVDLAESGETNEFCFPVQLVNRPHADFRGYCGTIVSGSVKIGDEVLVLPSGAITQVKDIVTMGGGLSAAVAGQAVTLVLGGDIDISRGDIICSPETPPKQSDQFQANIIWMSKQPLLPGRSYLLKTAHKTVSATTTDLRYKININDFSHVSAKSLGQNDIGVCNISLDRQIPFKPFKKSPQLGQFILIDKLTNETIGAGMINFALRRASNLVWQNLEIGKQQRAAHKSQKPAVLWFTGLSGAGKSTIASLVEQKLFERGRHTYILDGDNIRHGLNNDLGFTDADRVENIRRTAETAKLMLDAGLIVLVSFISPFSAERDMARQMMADGEFIEIYVNTPLKVAEARDVKGLYVKARRGEIKNFTGIDSEYQPPKAAEIHVDTIAQNAETAAMHIIDYLKDKKFL